MTETEAVIRALCISAYAEQFPQWAAMNSKRALWARDIVRQIALQPMGAIDGEETNA